jgi:GTPase SAR1 family protein
VFIYGAFMNDSMIGAVEILQRFLGVLTAINKRPSQPYQGLLSEASGLEDWAVNKPFTCAFLGSTGSGKSTLLSGLLHWDILPASNVPSTTQPIRIRHVLGAPSPAMGQFEGLSIREKLLERDDAYRTKGCMDSTPSIIETEIPFLRGMEGKLPLELVDTPGCTDAKGADLIPHAMDVLASCDAAVLVFNFTALLTETERRFIAALAKRRPDLFLRPGRTLFSVFTRMDQKDSRNQSLEAASASIRAQITEACTFRFNQGKSYVWGIKARQALDARMITSGRANQAVLAQFHRNIHGRQKVCHPDKRALERFAKILQEDSGLPRLERALARSLFAQANVIRKENFHLRLGNLIRRALRKTEILGDTPRNEALRGLMLDAKDQRFLPRSGK